MDNFTKADSHLASIVNSLPIGMLSILFDGTLTFINDNAKELLNLKNNSICTIDILSIIPKLKNILNKAEQCNDFTEENILIDYCAFRFNCDIYTLKENEIPIGVILLLKDIKSVLNTVNKYSSSQAAYSFNDIIGISPQLQKVINESKQISDSPSTVLINGESGCGKELLAQAIHNESSRKNNPFIAINCGAIPKTLIESELFGYEEGTFTGAKKGGQTGKFELANGGTIFLDEIGEMPLEMQVTLLRVLQEGSITRIGGKNPIPIDVRIIAATNKDLKEEIKKGTFRSDLFYRLNVIPLKLPPLKDRIGDVPVLIDYFLNIKSKKLNRPIPQISQKLYKKMISYCWPGNIRELENCVENIVNLNGVTTYEINFDECHCMTRDNLGNPITKDLQEISCDLNICEECSKNNEIIVPLLTLEQEAIKKAIRICDGNMTKTANCLGISRNALYNKIKRYNL